MGNNPVSYTDPLGLDIVSDVGGFLFGSEPTSTSPGSNGLFTNIGNWLSDTFSGGEVDLSQIVGQIDGPGALLGIGGYLAAQDQAREDDGPIESPDVESETMRALKRYAIIGLDYIQGYTEAQKQDFTLGIYTPIEKNTMAFWLGEASGHFVTLLNSGTASAALGSVTGVTVVGSGGTALLTGVPELTAAGAAYTGAVATNAGTNLLQMALKGPPSSSGGGKEPTKTTLPEKNILNVDGVTVKHNYGNTGNGAGSPKEHAPIHFHVEYKDIEYRLFPSGKPLKDSPTPPKKVLEVMRTYRSRLQNVERRIGKWFDELPDEFKNR